MSVSPRDLLSLAKELLAEAATEAEFRNAIGRAYYAAYHQAHQFHASLACPGRLPDKRIGVHAQLAFQLKNPEIPQSDLKFRTSQNIGRHLEWLHVKRVKADYHLDESVEPVECSSIVRRAERIFDLSSP